MLEFFRSEPYLVIILATLFILTLWVCYKADIARRRSSKENAKIMKKLDEENHLRNDFAILTPRLINEAQDEQLIKGIGINLFKSMENEKDLVAAFNELTDEQKEIYALYFLAEDGSERLSRFFEVNGQPLTFAAKSAVEKLYSGRFAEIFIKEYKAFDGEDENTSFVPSEIRALNDEFSAVLAQTDFYGIAAKYVRDNSEAFTGA